MKLIYLIGLPGCGKSTVMRAFMAKRTDWVADRPIDLLDSHVSGNVRVLGKYEDDVVFAGTDRLSMAVAPKAIEWAKTNPREVVLGEGDRLNNKGFLGSVDDLRIIHLFVSDDERERRYIQRGSNQSDKFIQTVRTKVNNIVEHFGATQTLFGEEEGCVEHQQCETTEDIDRIVNHLIHTITVHTITS